MRLPAVAILGSPNAGKSTIFNRLIGQRRAIVSDEPGVTRDRIHGEASWLGRSFTLIDTGGITGKKDEPFQEEIRLQVDVALLEADVIVFLVDGRLGVLPSDRLIARLLYKCEKPVILACNKIDNREQIALAQEFYALGLGEPLPISGAHGIGIGDLLDRIIAFLPETKKEDEKDAIVFTVIGRANVGKSTLINALIGEERVIVSSLPGTTRDVIDTRFKKDGINYVAVDTAGLSKRGDVRPGIEKYAMARAIEAIRRSEVILFLIDAEHGIVELDKNVAGYAFEEKKAVVIVVNKWDIAKAKGLDKESYGKKIRKEFKFLSYAPIVFVSALQKENITGLYQALQNVHLAYRKHVSTNVLNQVINEAQMLNPASMFKGGRLKIYYASEPSVCPPTFVLFVNDPRYAHFTYLRYLENRLREAFDLGGTPIRLILRKRL